MSDRIPADFALRVAMGMSDPEIADYSGVSDRTVRRWRDRLGLASRWTPEPAEHGSRSRYNAGCRCPHCRAANALYSADVRSLTHRVRRLQEARTA